MRPNDFIQQFSLTCWVCLSSNVLLSPWSFWCWGQGCVLSTRQPAVPPLFCKHHFVEHYQGLLLTNGLWGLRKSSEFSVMYIIRVFLLTWGLCFQGLNNMWNALPEGRTNWTVFFPTFPKHHNFLISVWSPVLTCLTPVCAIIKKYQPVMKTIKTSVCSLLKTHNTHLMYSSTSNAVWREKP